MDPINEKQTRIQRKWASNDRRGVSLKNYQQRRTKAGSGWYDTYGLQTQPSTDFAVSGRMKGNKKQNQDIETADQEVKPHTGPPINTSRGNTERLDQHDSTDGSPYRQMNISSKFGRKK